MPLTLFSTTTCNPCKIVAKKFTAAGVPFTKIDLDLPEHADTLAELKQSLGTDIIHTPTVIDNGSVALVGLDPAALNGLIEKHRRDEA